MINYNDKKAKDQEWIKKMKDDGFTGFDIFEDDFDLASAIIESIDSGEINGDDFAKELVLYLDEFDLEILKDFCHDHNFLDIEG